jgi:hypothetical protein
LGQCEALLMSHFDSHFDCPSRTRCVAFARRKSARHELFARTRGAGGVGAKIESGPRDAKGFANYVRDFEGMVDQPVSDVCSRLSFRP